MKATKKALITRLLPAVVVAAGALAGGSSPAAAETGGQRFHIGFEGPFTEAMTSDWPVVASGVVNDRGLQRIVSEGPGSLPGTVVAVAELLFPTGSITLQFDVTINDDRFFGPNGCHNAITAAGSFQVVASSGALAGASGSGTGRSRSTLFVPPTSDGCSFVDCRVVSHIDLSGSITIPEQD